MASATRSPTAAQPHPITRLDERHPDHAVVWLRGDYDASSAETLARTLRQAAGLDTDNVVIDLSGVEFLGSACVGVLLQAREQLRSHSRTLTLRSPSRSAARILDLCGATASLTLVPRDD